MQKYQRHWQYLDVLAPAAAALVMGLLAAPGMVLGTAPGSLAEITTSMDREESSSSGAAPIDERSTSPVEFNRQIRPILTDKCFLCHGPDHETRKAGMRLDSFESATATLADGGAAIVPGDIGQSKLMARITSDDPAFRMPPPDSGKTLTQTDVALLRRWIDEGAEYQPHWSYVPPKKKPLPDVSDPKWCRNEIDSFILARLDVAGLSPTVQATKEALIRRVTLDLTGLPPTVEEIDAFLNDRSPDAYEKVVDRLLASSRYGEHMARYWLDAARYGDTHGLHLDNYRSMWPWRDWVINALNSNMPFDQFTIEQLAGDLIPDATRDQLIATGFNRNNVTTSEGGAIDAEFLVKYAQDRVETTATVWMGLTAKCAECHDHKYDPISQKEFYQLFAFFNNVAENGMDGNAPNPPPIVPAPTEEQEASLQAVREALAAVRAQIDAPMPEVDSAQQRWENEVRARLTSRWQVLDPIEFRSTGSSTLEELEDHSILAKGENPAKDEYEIVSRTEATKIGLLRLEALTHESMPFNGPGRGANANFVLSEIEVEAVSITNPQERMMVPFAAAYADHEQMNGPFLVSQTIDGVIDSTNGWAIEGFKKRENRAAWYVAREPFGFEGGTELHVRLKFQTHFTQHAAGRVRLSVSDEQALYEEIGPISEGSWYSAGPFRSEDGTDAHEVAFEPEIESSVFEVDATFSDGSVRWVERRGFDDGKIHKLNGEQCATYLARTIYSPIARRVRFSIGSDDAVKIWVNGLVVLDRKVARPAAADQDQFEVDLRRGENPVLMKVTNYSGGYAFYWRAAEEDGSGGALKIAHLLETSADELGDGQRAELRRFYRSNYSPEIRALYEEAATLENRVKQMEAALPISLVMGERMDRRPAFVLHRGEYDQPREEVQPNVPAILPPLPDDVPRDRLALAKWLVGDDHPLTARVTVNRVWQQFFGIGIVRTAEDFGSQGEWPSHPELLDWLAVEFIESGWDVKHLVRLIVTSATYRQDAAVTAELLETDRENRLCARGPRFRMDAEMIRDLALAVSGLLVERLGGPSVKPYQPAGLWEAVGYPTSNTSKFMKDDAAGLYRRSIYTFWKRTSPPPVMAVFDAPNRETCTVRRPRTNTPLQVLAMMNSTQFVEASRKFAERILNSDATSDRARIVLAFRTATSRVPDEFERSRLESLLSQQRASFSLVPSSAAELLSVGDSETDRSLDSVELASWMGVTGAILMLDEVVTKG